MTVKQLLKNNPDTVYRVGAKSGFMFIGNYADFIKYKNKINERYNYYHEAHRYKDYYKIRFNHCDKRLIDWYEYKPLENRDIISVNTYGDVNVVIVEGLDVGECLTDDEFIIMINTYSQTQLAMKLGYKSIEVYKVKCRDKIRKVKFKICTEEDRYILLDENNTDIIKWDKFIKLSKI